MTLTQLTRDSGACDPLAWFCSKKITYHWVHLLTALLKDARAIMTGLYMWVGTRRPGIFQMDQLSSACRWEFDMTHALDYEWDVIRGRQPNRWAICQWVSNFWLRGRVLLHFMNPRLISSLDHIYSTRCLPMLMSVAMNQIANNVTGSIECQVCPMPFCPLPCIHVVSGCHPLACFSPKDRTHLCFYLILLQLSPNVVLALATLLIGIMRT